MLSPEEFQAQNDIQYIEVDAAELQYAIDNTERVLMMIQNYQYLHPGNSATMTEMYIRCRQVRDSLRRMVYEELSRLDIGLEPSPQEYGAPQTPESFQTESSTSRDSESEEQTPDTNIGSFSPITRSLSGSQHCSGSLEDTGSPLDPKLSRSTFLKRLHE